MKYSTKLSDTVHVMVLIAINKEKSLSSASIAESVHTNPGFVRQLMLKLKKAGLMTSVAGHARPSLSKPADQITLLDVYKAVETLVKTATHRRCGKVLTNIPAEMDKSSSTKEAISEYRNSDFQFSGIGISLSLRGYFFKTCSCLLFLFPFHH